MPDLSNLPPLKRCMPSCGSSVSILGEEGQDALCCKWDHRLRLPITSRAVTCSTTGAGEVGQAAPKRERKGGKRSAKSFEDHVDAWTKRKVESGKRLIECSLPFLANSPRMVDCRFCSRPIYPGDEIVCTVHGCKEKYHMSCVTQSGTFSKSRSFRCPRHGCIICKQVGCWHCIRCHVSAHTRCSPWPDSVTHVNKIKSQALCWRHPANWRVVERGVMTKDVEEAFSRLPIPYIAEDFIVDSILKDFRKEEPTPYIHIRRNSYLIKKKRDDAYVGVGCTCDRNSPCNDECECRGQSISCSKACNCSDLCANRPFRKDKKVKVVKTENCGWGVEASEAIKKGEFVIEYIGEVISDALCEKRLWDMKYRGDQKFYMCEITKDFTIDATFKGNSSRFLNHSCDPNCVLEKWHVDGETRVGVFASRDIQPHEALTYDYRFVHFGPMVKCRCGAFNCRGYLGSKKKVSDLILNLDPAWGSKRKRSSIRKTSLKLSSQIPPRV
ncbi:SET domain group 4 [Wolffia australiana]